MFTVKSPASKFSRISLQTVKKDQMSQRRKSINAADGRGADARHSHQHGAAHQDQEVETLLVRKQGVPYPDDVWQEELLRQQQGEPAEGEILRFDVLLFLSGHSSSEPLADVLSGSEGTTELTAWVFLDYLMYNELKHEDIEIPYGATPLEHISFKGCAFRSNGTFWRKPGSQTTLFQLEYVLWLKMKQKVQMNQALAERVRTADSISS